MELVEVTELDEPLRLFFFLVLEPDCRPLEQRVPANDSGSRRIKLVGSCFKRQFRSNSLTLQRAVIARKSRSLVVKQRGSQSITASVPKHCPSAVKSGAPK